MNWKIVISIFVLFSLNGLESVAETRKDWWQNTVLYQIYPRSFKDSDGDGIGDLRGIISKLDHLHKSGIGATWLSPIFKSPMVDFGYDISNFTDIHEEYGTMKDFEDLLAKANTLGIKIILDYVPNHSSDKCDWFVKSINREEGYEDFYVWSNGIKDEKTGQMKPPNNWQSVFYGSAWTWHPKRKQFYLHQFTAGQPDLNFRNPKVVETMDNVIKFWLDKGVSGFRVDAVNHLFEVEDFRDEPLSGITQDFKSYDYTHHYYTKDLPEAHEMVYHWRSILDEHKSLYGGETRLMLTEAYANISSTMEFYENSDGTKLGAQVPFNFLLLGELNEHSDARDFLLSISKWRVYMPYGATANWVLGNHDNPRVGSRYGKDRIDAMNIMLMTLPGIAITYNGEEIGMVDFRDISWEDTKDPPALNSNPETYKTISRDPVRTPFQWDDTKNAGFSEADKTWLPVHPDFAQNNLLGQTNANKSHYSVYTSLVNLRKDPTMVDGAFHATALKRTVLAFKRELRGQPTILTVINLSADQQTVNLKQLDSKLPDNVFVIISGTNSLHKEGNLIKSESLSLGSFDSVVLRGINIDFSPRRELVKNLIKYGQIGLVGLLMFRLWNNKWTKLSLYERSWH